MKFKEFRTICYCAQESIHNERSTKLEKMTSWQKPTSMIGYPSVGTRSTIMEGLWRQKWRPCIGPVNMGQLELDEEPVPEDDRAADAEDLGEEAKWPLPESAAGLWWMSKSWTFLEPEDPDIKTWTCPYFLYENKAEKNADKITITDDIQSKSGQSWASNTKLSFKETNQPFCDKLITLYSFTMEIPDCTRSYSHFKEGIISFLF